MVLNVHRRVLPVPVSQAGWAIDELLAPSTIWPGDAWPAMRLRPGLVEGPAAGTVRCDTAW
ncbi:hypothetical protein DWB68_11040 [Galactobacter valiniphilus]|uniref:Uncharacterized protein n=1 Tax=Galactobacter valiniphilus TaxID=2676122 RepID=A0A399JBT3_9MICC|nr:hypothetical protein [Galactobacter valiniphilus]RII41699.1 hypothetical protein DWB68_11040 [Galactobacter valiniphilus]